jgi:hypothetical protein
VSHLTEKEQDEGRNAVQSLKGFILRLKKDSRITNDEKTLVYIWLKRIGDIFDGCSGICKEE